MRKDDWLRIGVTAAVFASFVLDSFVRYPIPGPNEPHYLCKAKHYWSPDWCARDFFLDSSNAHVVFYETFGLLTRCFSLQTTAVIGRLIGLLILAAGWSAFIRAFVPGKWPPFLAAWTYLGLSAVGSLSGEWLVGGIESKVVAYGLLFWAAAIWLDYDETFGKRRIAIAAALTGTAISFHPVVGIWGLAAGMFASVVRAFIGRKARVSRTRTECDWRLVVAAILLLAILAAPGVIGALRSSAGSDIQADWLQVYYRLAHHLDPMHFGANAGHWWDSPWAYYALLSLSWLIGRHWMSRRQGEKWFFWFVVGSGLIACVGLAAGWRSGLPEQMPYYAARWKLLKVYPFRLFDVMAPIAVAVTIAGLVRHWCEIACDDRRRVPRWTVGLTYALVIVPIAIAVLRLAPDARPPLSVSQTADWFDACNWIRTQTPPDALVMTPLQNNWAFKWFAQRAEFVSFKDCPQDSRGIEEWNNRFLFHRAWRQQHLESGFSTAATRVLGTKYGINYIVADRLGPFTFPPVHRNETFRIYQIPE
jgi:hypothetical protein